MKTKEYNLEVYSRGLTYLSICTNMPPKEVEMWLGEHEPTQIDSPWKIADENFRTGEKNGCACPDKEGNKHWLVSC